MEGMFRQLGIWSSVGQNYTPQDAAQLMFYKESKDGPDPPGSITEAGAMAAGSPRRAPTARTPCR